MYAVHNHTKYYSHRPSFPGPKSCLTNTTAQLVLNSLFRSNMKYWYVEHSERQHIVFDQWPLQLKPCLLTLRLMCSSPVPLRSKRKRTNWEFRMQEHFNETQSMSSLAAMLLTLPRSEGPSSVDSFFNYGVTLYIHHETWRLGRDAGKNPVVRLHACISTEVKNSLHDSTQRLNWTMTQMLVVNRRTLRR